MRLLLLTGEAEGQDSLCQGLSSHMVMALSTTCLGSYEYQYPLDSMFFCTLA